MNCINLPEFRVIKAEENEFDFLLKEWRDYINWNEYLLKNTYQSIDIRRSSVYRRGYHEGYFEGFNNVIKIFQKDLELARLSRLVVIKINNHKIDSD